ncbi:16581_t:CDS:2, partial [Entrophospora sp. SA101]
EPSTSPLPQISFDVIFLDKGPEEQRKKCANWLADNNPYLREYKNALVTNSSGSVSSSPTATHLPDDETAPEFQSGDIIVPHQNFPSEIHNEDSHYSRLIAGFIKNDDSNDDSNSLPVSFDFDHLEALLFPDLFPDGHGDYKEMKSCSRNQQQRIDTYGKYIKQHLLGVDSRFHLHHHWPAWSYLQLEKLRNFQNNQRIANQKNVDETHRLPTAVEIIEESAYMSGWQFSETNTSTIPSFIRTGHWIHLRHILGASDNFDTVPSNRPLHTTLHFIHCHQNLKRLIWKDPDVCGWGTCKDFFEHVEFQNREPELYECVMRLQIHSCNSKCDGPVPYARPNGEPFDNITYKDYIEQYDIKLSAINSSSQTIYRDNLGNYVVKRKTNILTRYRNLWLEHGELYFNQNLLLRVPARSEGDLIGTYETYRDHYLVRFPEEFGNSIKSDQQNQHHQTINMLDQYTNLIENLLYSLQSLLTQDIKGIIRSQLENIKILPPIVPNNSMLSLPSCQYNCVQTIFNYMGPRDTYHYPYFFISGSAGSGKSFLINLFAKKFLELNKNFLLMAPTGVAAVNIQGQTIHSALRIWSHGGRYQTLAFADQEFNQELRKIDTIIIDEVSMVQASLLTFISEMFSGIHQIFAPFGGINVILIGDLAQLPPINGHPVYQSPIWKVFYPIFLCHSHRQQNDPFFYNVLQKIRLGNITPSVWRFLQEKANQSLSLEMSSLHTSYIVGFRKSASYINQIICNHLPALNNKFTISEAIDCVDGRMVDNSYEHLIKNKTNLPGSLSYVSLSRCSKWEDVKINSLSRDAFKVDPSMIKEYEHLEEIVTRPLPYTLGGRYQTLAFADQEFNQELRKIDTIIIDEVSMVQASLLTFISEMFSGIHQIFAPFGGINVILIGDLAQLPPINGHPVYQSPIWKVFYPIFLCHSHRQQNDPFFYNVLQKIRLGNITPSVWRFLQEKANQSLSLEMSSLHTSYIVGFRKSASYINQIICNHLPALNNKFTISEAIDCVDGRMVDNTYVSLSRCSKWEDVKINSLSRDAFKVDPSMIKEYEHLEEIVTRPLPYTVHGAHQFANNSS